MVCFNSIDHATVLLQSLFVSEKYSDLTISAGKTGKCWNVHKSILAESTKYFEVMLSSSFKEASDYKIVIDDVDGDILETVLKFLYCGSVDITDVDFAGRLLERAHLMQISELVKYCFEYLGNNLTAENCIGLYLLAVKYEEKDMIKKFLEFAIKNFLKVIQFSEYLDLDLKTLRKYLYSTFPSEDVENVKATTMVKWIDASPKDRSCHIGQFIRDLDYYFINDANVLKRLQSKCKDYTDITYINNQLIKQICGSQLILICQDSKKTQTIKSFNLRNKSTSDLGEIDANETILTTWNGKFIATKFCFISGRSLFFYEDNNFKVKKNETPLAISGVPIDALVVDDHLYLMTELSIYKIELKTGKMMTIRTVTVNYAYFSSVVHCRKLYFLSRKSIAVVKMECFNIDDDNWQTMPDFSHSMGNSKASAVSYRNDLFYLDMGIHIFNFENTTTWKKVTTWNFSGLSSVRVNNEIYFLQEQNIYKFDPINYSRNYNLVYSSLPPISKIISI